MLNLDRRLFYTLRIVKSSILWMFCIFFHITCIQCTFEFAWKSACIKQGRLIFPKCHIVFVHLFLWQCYLSGSYWRTLCEKLFYLTRRTKFNDPTSPISMAVNVSRNGTDFLETAGEPWKNIEEGHSSVEKSEKCRMQTKKQFLLSTSIDDNRALWKQLSVTSDDFRLLRSSNNRGALRVFFILNR